MYYLNIILLSLASSAPGVLLSDQHTSIDIEVDFESKETVVISQMSFQHIWQGFYVM